MKKDYKGKYRTTMGKKDHEEKKTNRKNTMKKDHEGKKRTMRGKKDHEGEGESDYENEFVCFFYILRHFK